jgi:quinol monooxygenase YgiN
MSDHVFWMLECTIKDGQLETLKGLMDEMVMTTRANEPGALNYEWSISSDERTLHILERYADSEAALVHMATFSKSFASRFMGSLKVTRYTVYGRPNEKVLQMLSSMGAVYMSPLGGFSR